MRTGNEDPRAEGTHEIPGYPAVLPGCGAAATDAKTALPGRTSPDHKP